jgi:catechol 2,3-dioxygenase-like lactoylglutathione lyase family enzyme
VIERINAIVVPVRDVRTCALFYSEKLGFTLDQLENQEAYLTLPGKGTVLALKSMEFLAKEISQEKIGPGERSFNRTHCVTFVDNVDKEFEDLSRKGVHFVKAPETREGGWRTAHVEDPEGNLWEISQRPTK